MGVPGELAGLWEAHAKFGKVQWSELVQPIRELAQNGFPAGTMLAKSLEEYKEKIKADPILRFVHSVSLQSEAIYLNNVKLHALTLNMMWKDLTLRWFISLQKSFQTNGHAFFYVQSRVL